MQFLRWNLFFVFWTCKELNIPQKTQTSRAQHEKHIWQETIAFADKRKWVLVIHIQEGPWADPGFFQRWGCKYESSRQTFQGQGMGKGELEGNV